jgi:hypothetical protein
MRDCYIANVLTQVFERHFMDDISSAAPNQREYNDKSFMALVEEDLGLESQKNELKDKIVTLQECLDIPEPYR